MPWNGMFPEFGCEDLIKNITNFGTEKHDDLADAFSLLVNYCFTQVGKPITEDDIDIL
jgi:phage terminase large subunit-like protein